MTTNATVNTPPTSAKAWGRVLARYRGPSPGRSAAEIALTAVPLPALWIAMWLCLQVSCWLCLALAPLAAAFLVRLSPIEHDWSHDACFRTRAADGWVGRVNGVSTLTPYDCSRRMHAIHHATVGNLDQRGIGDVTTLTVAEYGAASRMRRLLYRFYRHPVVMFGLGPAWLFLVQYRLPIGLMWAGWKPWAGTRGTIAATASLVAGLVWWLGVAPVLLVPLPVLLVAASAGVWLFDVQHRFEETNWSAAPNWTHASTSAAASRSTGCPR